MNTICLWLLLCTQPPPKTPLAPTPPPDTRLVVQVSVYAPEPCYRAPLCSDAANMKAALSECMKYAPEVHCNVLIPTGSFEYAGPITISKGIGLFGQKEHPAVNSLGYRFH